MKQLGVLKVYLYSALDGMLVQSRVTLRIKFTGTNLYSWTERGTVRVKCFAQDHNPIFPARVQTRTTQSGDERTNHEATMASLYYTVDTERYIDFRNQIHNNYSRHYCVKLATLKFDDRLYEAVGKFYHYYSTQKLT